jgi:hypothetical protein
MRNRYALTVLGVDVLAPVALFYALRVAGVGSLVALLVGGAPPALRMAAQFARRRRLDAIGAVVVPAVAAGALGSLISGSARTLLIREALMGIPFALWMALSVRAARPLTYRMAASLLPHLEHRLEAAWNTDATFRRVWRRLAGLWAVGTLLHAGALLGMALALPVDQVPALDTALWLAMFVALQVVTNVALYRNRAWRRIFAADGRPGRDHGAARARGPGRVGPGGTWNSSAT